MKLLPSLMATALTTSLQTGASYSEFVDNRSHLSTAHPYRPCGGKSRSYTKKGPGRMPHNKQRPRS